MTLMSGVRTQILQTSHGQLTPDAYQTCLQVLQKSGLIVLPTDTVYGIACNAFDPVAIKKIYALKGRDYTKPLPILLGSSQQLNLVAREVPKEVEPLVQRFWPGPLTLVFKTAPTALQASRGKETIAVRVPDHGVIRDLLKKTGLPLAATSANRSGEESLKTGARVVEAFSDRVDVIIDGGRCHFEKESSVVDATHYPFTVLREGVLKKDKLYQALL